jgi:hypothetical protein
LLDRINLEMLSSVAVDRVRSEVRSRWLGWWKKRRLR